MTRGFYEQLGVHVDADADQIKAAYGRAVAHLLRRREATVAHGGDTSALDLARQQLDEAWEVLSDPARRRRYDAMLAVAGDGITDTDLEDLWSRVAGAMIHPTVAAAARLVDATTTLSLQPLPEPPRPSVTPSNGSPWESEVSAPAAARTPAGAPALGFGQPRPVRRDGAMPTTPPPVASAPAARASDAGPVEGAGGARTPLAARVPRPAPPTRRHPPGSSQPAPATAQVPAGASARPSATASASARPPGASVSAAGPGTSPGVASVSARGPHTFADAGTSPGVGDTSSAEMAQLLRQHGPCGELLRVARERRGLSIQQLADTTRISARYLEAIEAEEYGALPSAAAFVRGYVREMARILGLDVDAVVHGYMRRFRGEG